jgi:hypothetical protein
MYSVVCIALNMYNVIYVQRYICMTLYMYSVVHRFTPDGLSVPPRVPTPSVPTRVVLTVRPPLQARALSVECATDSLTLSESRPPSLPLYTFQGGRGGG